ncbi:hypothetical protein O1611_g5918 [Lasiodiplodia mahajangana]|uniref:Uncharacterized protein n=1 Tax=Lasiodiplodia mahajangana TaxID=1108764 RepID=A0ACC2JKJ3_9PEZI|nr:hypothetical protein O1611_g5918 [Lasiodiplodia mahajangana]
MSKFLRGPRVGPIRWEATSYADAIKHLLRLSTAADDDDDDDNNDDDKGVQQQQQDVDVLRHWAILRILRLLHIPLLRDPDAAESYTSDDGFTLVVKAYEEAINALYDMGGKIEDATYYLHSS